MIRVYKIILLSILIWGIGFSVFAQSPTIDSLNQEAFNKLYAQTDESLLISESVITHCKNDTASTINQLLTAWINCANAIFIQKDYYRALDTLDNCILYINKLDDIVLSGRLLNLYSSAHKELRNDTVSLSSYYNEIWLKNDTATIQKTAINLNEMGDYYLKIGNLNRALFYYQKYLSWVQRGNDSVLIADAYHHIGTVYQNLTAPEKALEFYFKAYEIKKRNSDKNDLAKSITNIGAIYLIQQVYDSAIIYMNEANIIFKEANNLIDLSKTLSNLGIAYDQQKNFEKAVECYNESYKIALELHNSNEMAISLLNIGGLHYTQGNTETALAYFQKAEHYANETRNIILKSRLKFGLSVLLEKLGYPEKALSALRAHLVLQDSIFSENTTKQIAEMGAKYELERKNQEISNLNKDAEIKELKLTQKQSQTRFLLTILIAILVTLTLIIYLFTQRGKLNSKLKEHNQIIQEQNEELSIINEELKTINDQLIFSEERLQKSNKTKQKLLSIIAHDIRNPLLAAKSFVQVLRQNSRTFSTSDIEKHAGLLETSILTIGELLNNLLFWGKTQQKETKIFTEQLSLNELITNNIRLVHYWTIQKELEINFTTNQEITVTTDRNIIDLILRNLISNAIKFSYPNNNITINLSAIKKEFVDISITDSGMGMDKETLDNLFTDSNKTSLGTQNEKGTGLGLQLCHSFIKQINGEITVQSELNKGTTFKILLPAVFSK